MYLPTEFKFKSGQSCSFHTITLEGGIDLSFLHPAMVEITGQTGLSDTGWQPV